MHYHHAGPSPSMSSYSNTSSIEKFEILRIFNKLEQLFGVLKGFLDVGGRLTGGLNGLLGMIYYFWGVLQFHFHKIFYTY